LLMVSMTVSKLGCSPLFFVEPGVKVDGHYYQDVLLKQQMWFRSQISSHITWSSSLLTFFWSQFAIYFLHLPIKLFQLWHLHGPYVGLWYPRPHMLTPSLWQLSPGLLQLSFGGIADLYIVVVSADGRSQSRPAASRDRLIPSTRTFVCQRSFAIF